MGKTVISVEKPGDETDFIVGIISQNLDTYSNFIGFQDSQNFTFFEAPSVESDTWHMVDWLTLSHVSKREDKSNK